jgi:nucleoid DNA-binding protein
MRTARWLALAALLGMVGLVAGQQPATKTKKAQEKKDESIPQRIARDTKLTEKDAEKFFNALGPAIRDQLQRGKSVTVPGLGTFRVVRVAEHKDLAAGGRPIVVPAFNTVEFVGSIEVAEGVNAEGVTPAETVPGFQYIPNPYPTPPQKTGRTYTPSQRVK